MKARKWGGGDGFLEVNFLLQWDRAGEGAEMRLARLYGGPQGWLQWDRAGEGAEILT